MEYLTKEEWEQIKKSSDYTLKSLGFFSPEHVKRALKRCGCTIVSPMNPVTIDGERI